MLKQIDLNVNKPESRWLPPLYPGDSINTTVLRVHFESEDEQTVLQLIKDAGLQRSLWNKYPVRSHLQDKIDSLWVKIWRWLGDAWYDFQSLIHGN